MTKPANWAARLEHVREVSLSGTADLTFWQERLNRSGLAPLERDRRAEVLITATSATFWGISFRELVFAVLVSPGRASETRGAYLIQAFNSRRVFAWCERTFFSTPYRHGEISLSTALPVWVQLVRDGNVLFKAAMHPDTVQQRKAAALEEGWEGTVTLPDIQGGREGGGRMFYALVGGRAQGYSFAADKDSLLVRPWPGLHVLQNLLDSDFVAREWIVREDAVHARTKTYRTTPSRERERATAAQN